MVTVYQKFTVNVRLRHKSDLDVFENFLNEHGVSEYTLLKTEEYEMAKTITTKSKARVLFAQFTECICLEDQFKKFINDCGLIDYDITVIRY